MTDLNPKLGISFWITSNKRSAITAAHRSWLVKKLTKSKTRDSMFTARATASHGRKWADTERMGMMSAENNADEWVHDGHGHLRLRLRDFFAAFAMASLSYEHLTASDAARAAYQRADAMLIERQQKAERE